MNRRDLRLGLALLATPFSIGAASAGNAAPLLAVHAPAAKASIAPAKESIALAKANVAAADGSSDADDGGAAMLSSGVTFGRALDLQGTPLILRSARQHGTTGGLFTAGFYTGPFVRPSGLPVHASNVSSSFGTRWHPLLGGYRFHAGVDLVAPTGTQILATSPGVITEAGWCGGYGFCVTVDHGDGYHTLYGHLSRVDVSAGERVASGQRVGLVGSTGQSTGPHLHYEVRFNGRPVDPRPYLSQR